jgi:TonB-linked SusC/RagA family outer membrane protein
VAGIRGNTNSPLTTDYIHNWTGVGSRTTISLGADADLIQDLKMITEGLKFKASISYNNNSYWSGTTVYNGDYYVFTPGIGSSYTWNRYINGTQDNYTVIQDPYQNPIQAFSAGDTPNKKDYNYAFQFDYARSFGLHNVSGLGLLKRRVSQIGDKFSHYEENWVGRTTYDYDGRYLFEVNVGIAGSEQFAPENRFGVFPAYAIGWNLGREKFMKSLPMISNLKIRYSYGQTGSDNTGLDYLYLSDFTNFPPAGYVNSTYPFVIGAPGSGTSVINALAEGAVPNKIAQWERATKNNIGFDLGFYNNKLSITFELFDEHRTGILMSRNAISDMFGQSTKALNFGATKKHGYELEIGYKNNIGKLNYYVKGNFNFNENRVIEQDDLYATPAYRKNEGKPINFGRSQLNIGYYQDIDEMKNYSLGDLARTAIGSDKVLDFDGNGVLNERDIIPIGYTDRPNKTYGLTAGITYKNFDFNFLVQGALEVNRNYAAYNRPLWSFDGSDDMYIKMQGANDIWSPENRTAEYAVWGGWNPASKGILNGQYIRLKSVEFGYALTNDALNSIGLKSARFALIGSNLLTYAPGYMLGDPENEPNVFPYDKSLQFYPNPRLLTMSLNITF